MKHIRTARPGALILAALGAGLGLPQAALAQTADAPVAADEADAPQAAGEIVVTAQRRNERLVDVPISITAASGEQLRSSVIGTTRDLAQIAPGLVMTSNGSAFQPAVRGVTSTSTANGDDANVSLYVDDMYISNNVASLMDLMDVQRVEVLKGPQGTLFGRNATGGAIRIVTREPSERFTAEGSATYVPRFKEYKLGGYVSGPLADGIAVSVSGSYSDNDGIGFNINPARYGQRLGTTKSHAVRGKVLLTPASNVRLLFSVDNSRYDSNVPYLLQIENNNNTTTSANNPGVIFNPGIPYQTNVSVTPTIVGDQTGVSFTGSVELGGYTLKSLTQYRLTEQLSAGDLDRTNLSSSSFQSPADQKLFTQEVTLNSEGNDFYNFTVGAFYLNQKSNARSRVFAGDYTNLSSIAHGTLKTESISGFGELNVKPAPQLTLTFGGRYNVETKKWTYVDDFRPAGIRSAADETTWRNFTYRIIARYEFMPDSNVYASYSTGFKSGAYNTVTFPLNKVRPERIKAFEAGLKSRLAPRTFLTLAAYAYDYDDIQIQAFDSSPTALRIVLLNAATAKVRGAEATFETHPGIFNFSAGLSWIPRAEYVSFPSGFMTIPKTNASGVPTGGNNSVAPINLSRTRMIRTPRFTANLAGGFDLDAMGGKLGTTANITYNDGFVWWPGERLKQKSYWQVNARIGWTAPDQRWNVFVYGENLAGALVGVYEGTSNTGDAISWGRPRNVGFGAGFKF